MWLAPRAAPARRAKRDGAPCAVKALGRRLLARDSVRSRLEVAHPRPALTLRVGAHLLGRLLVTDRASRHPSFLAGSGVRRAVALLSIIGLPGLRRARGRPVPDPRPRREVRCGLRRGLPHRRRRGDPDTVPLAAGQRARRTLRADRTDRMPGLAADPRTAPTRPRPARLRRPLQHPSAHTERSGANRRSRFNRQRRRRRQRSSDATDSADSYTSTTSPQHDETDYWHPARPRTTLLTWRRPRIRAS